RDPLLDPAENIVAPDDLPSSRSRELDHSPQLLNREPSPMGFEQECLRPFENQLAREPDLIRVGRNENLHPSSDETHSPTPLSVIVVRTLAMSLRTFLIFPVSFLLSPRAAVLRSLESSALRSKSVSLRLSGSCSLSNFAFRFGILLHLYLLHVLLYLDVGRYRFLHGDLPLASVKSEFQQNVCRRLPDNLCRGFAALGHDARQVRLSV